MDDSKLIKGKIDSLSIMLYLGLVIFGWFNLYSSASIYTENTGDLFSFSQRYGKQLIWIIIAITMVGGLMFIEGHVISSLSYVIYGILIFLLLLVLVIGVNINNSTSWIQIGTFRIQPSEFMKFGIALALAKFMSSENFKIMNPRNLFIIALIIFIPGVLILKQNDTGTAIVLAVFLFVLYRQGLPLTYLILIFIAVLLFVFRFYIEFYAIMIILTAAAYIIQIFINEKRNQILFSLVMQLGIITLFLAAIIIFRLNIRIDYVLATSTIIVAVYWVVTAIKARFSPKIILAAVLLGSIVYTYSVDYIYYNILKEHQQKRLNVFFGKEEDKRGAAYNLEQSLIAIGSGGLTGKGYLQGTQTKLDFVPEQDTDFIFCTVGEEWGFTGTAFVVILFTLLVLRIIYLAEKQMSVFSRIYGYSVAMILFFHFSVNIAMTIGLAPVIGIPLPFYSYGGSSLWSFTILLFIFLRLDMNRNQTL